MMFNLAYANIKNNKGKTAINIIILSLSLIVFILVNTITASLNGLVTTVCEMPEKRTITVGYNSEKEERQEFENKLNRTQHIVLAEQRYQPIMLPLTTCSKTFTQELTKGEYVLYVNAYYSAENIPLISGELPLKSGEIIIPKYFQPYYAFDESMLKSSMEYVDGESLLGATITCTYSDRIDTSMEHPTSQYYTYTAKVVGVYNAIQKYNSPKDVYAFKGDVGEIRQNTFGSVINQANDYDVIVDKYENIESVAAALKEKGYNAETSKTNFGLKQVSFLVGGVAIVISIITILLMMIIIYYLISSLIKKRTKLLATLKSMGYKSSKLFFISLIENTLIGFIGAGIAILITFVMFFPLRGAILTNIFSIYFRNFNIDIQAYIYTVLFSLAAGILIPAIVTLLSVSGINNISPAKAIKYE